MTTLKKSALKTLAGMQEIIENEMLLHGTYATNRVVNHHLADSGAICGGHQMCAIGSLFVAGGVPVIDILRREAAGTLREKTLDENPGLRLAYEVLNGLSKKFMQEGELLAVDYDYDGSLENLFEAYLPRMTTGRSHHGGRVASNDEREVLLKLIKKARKKIGRL